MQENPTYANLCPIKNTIKYNFYNIQYDQYKGNDPIFKLSHNDCIVFNFGMHKENSLN